MKAHSTAGFTLIEVLVALAILGLTFGVSLATFSSRLARIDQDRQLQYATLIAQSQLARVGHDVVLNDGAIGGLSDDGYSWRIETAPYGTGAGGLIGHRVTVTVGWGSGLRHREVQLESLRLGMAGAGQ